MKRVLSLMLCAIMVCAMTVTAFAAVNTDGWYKNETFAPGSELYFELSWLKEQAGADADFGETDVLNSNDYRVSFDIDHGSGLVANTYIDDDEERVVIKLKNDYTMYKEKEVKGTLELRCKGHHKVIKVPISFTVNNNFDNTSIDFNVPGEENTLPVEPNTVYEVTDTAPYGTLIFMGVDGSTEVIVRVYEGDHFYLASNENVNKTVVRNNEDVIGVDTDIRFLSFPAVPQFDATATVYFYDTNKDYHVYAIGSDNKLTEIGAWDEEEGCIVYKTKSLGSYVICDTKLAVEAATKPVAPSKPNPGTGGGAEAIPNPNTGVDTTGMNIAMAMLGISAIGIVAAVGVKKRINHN